ncbi:M48 family metalloprotease [Streptomyces sp. TLI_171]|uniref:M48 family metalloprotease n=1 Tax=Streptomyces sp. TLI_171 TaxID=1938859 RepID=UPI000C17ED39|nr:M48 family metalloprotease [Streptomyces sp. TLI_171]RKE18875.1 peptidase M48-like protein [Streptomyces sp. TLI_171]
MSTTESPAAIEAATPAKPCPQCGAPLSVSERFPTWCPRCEWNLLPATPPVEYRTARARRRAAREERREEAARQAVKVRTEHVFRQVAAGESDLRSGPAVAAFALAGLVHLVSLTVLVTGAALVAGLLSPSWPARGLGVVALAVAVLIRPRLGRPQRDGVLTRDAAPVLYGLVDQVSEALGAPKVDSIVVTDRFNASVGVLGLRRHRQLDLGLPLWEMLPRQQKVALLGHEIGHYVNGDSRSGLWTGSAVGSLAEWERLTHPSPDNESRRILLIMATFVANLLLWVVNRAVRALTGLMFRLHLRSGQAAEYRADRLAAQLASVRDARAMLTALLNGPTVEAVVIRQRSRPARRPAGRSARTSDAAPAPDLWESLAEAVRTIPAGETERRIRESERNVSSVDGSHPPTYLRLRMLDTAPPPVDRAPLVLDAGRAAAIEAELAESRVRVARALL